MVGLNRKSELIRCCPIKRSSFIHDNEGPAPEFHMPAMWIKQDPTPTRVPAHYAGKLVTSSVFVLRHFLFESYACF